MIKLKIISKNNYNYVLEDTNSKKYNVNIEFYSLEEQPSIGDFLYMSEKIVREVNIYSFGLINSLENVSEDDIIKVIIKGKEYYLQRYYG